MVKHVQTSKCNDVMSLMVKHVQTCKCNDVSWTKNMSLMVFLEHVRRLEMQ